MTVNPKHDECLRVGMNLQRARARAHTHTHTHRNECSARDCLSPALPPKTHIHTSHTARFGSLVSGRARGRGRAGGRGVGGNITSVFTDLHKSHGLSLPNTVWHPCTVRVIPEMGPGLVDAEWICFGILIRKRLESESRVSWCV